MGGREGERRKSGGGIYWSKKSKGATRSTEAIAWVTKSYGGGLLGKKLLFSPENASTVRSGEGNKISARTKKSSPAAKRSQETFVAVPSNKIDDWDQSADMVTRYREKHGSAGAQQFDRKPGKFTRLRNQRANVTTCENQKPTVFKVARTMRTKVRRWGV